MKKTLAIVLAMLMVLSCLPTAMAYSNFTPDGQQHVHVWIVDYGEPATCTQPGTDYWTCAECQYFEVRHPAPTGHYFSDWIVVHEATPQSDGLLQRSCVVCDKQEYKPLPYDPTAPTLYVPDPSEGPVVPTEPVMPVDGAALALSVEPVLPADGARVGDTIPVTVTVTNTGTVTFTEIYVNRSGYDIALGWGPVELLPGESFTGSTTIYITEEDARNGAAEALFCGMGITERLDQVSSGDAAVSIPVTDLPERTTPELVLVVSKAAPIKDAYDNGEAVAIHWTITNVGGMDCELSELMVMGADVYESRWLSGVIGAHGGSASGEVELNLPTLPADAFVDNRTSIALSVAASGYGTEDATPAYVGGQIVVYNIVQRELDEWVPEEAPTDSPLSLTKTVVSTPADPAGYAVGETIDYELTVTNTGDKPVSDVWLVDDMNRERVSYDELAPGDSRTLNYSHTVTEIDANWSTFVTNTAHVGGTDPETGLQYPYVSGDVTVPIRTDAARLVLTKEVISTPADPNGYVNGEVVTYQVTVTNPTDYRMVDMTIYDSMCQMTVCEGIALEPHYSYTAIYRVMVCEHDAMNGIMINSCRASAVVEETGESITGHVRVAVPVLYEQGGDVVLRKSVISSPANGNFYRPGEWVTFELELENRSDRTFTDVTVVDSLLEGSSSQGIVLTSSRFFSTFTWPVSYQVTELDADLGTVVNSAYFTATDIDDPFYTVTGTSNEVMVPVGRAARDIEVIKATVSTPANGSYYTENETIEYRIDVLSSGSEEVTFELFDNLNGNSVLMDTITLPPYSCTARSYYYQVTAEDVARGYMENCASVRMTDDAAVYISNTVVDFTGVNGGLRVVKDLYAADEETLSYSITVYNDSDVDIENVTVWDHPGNRPAMAPWQAFTVPAHDSFSVDITLAITERDRLDGVQINQASAVAPGYAEVWSNITEYPLFDEPETPAEGLRVAKSVMGEFGPYVGYKVTVYNDTDSDISGITVMDYPGSGEAFVIESGAFISAHESVSYSAVPVPITDQERANGVQYNQACASAPGFDDAWSNITEYYLNGDPVPAPTDPVPAPTDPVPAPTDPVPAPTDPVPAPTDPVPAPTDPVPAPTDPTAPTDGDGTVGLIPPEDVEDPTTPTEGTYGGKIALLKCTTSTPINGIYYTEGEWIDYDICVLNYSDTSDGDFGPLTDTVDGEASSTLESANVLLTAGSSVHYEFHHQVNAADVARGYVTNTAACDSSSGALSSTVTDFCSADPFGVITDLEVVKSEVSSPANGMYYVEGEHVYYEAAITNHSEIPVDVTVITDVVYGGVSSSRYTSLTLAPDESYTAAFQQIVSADDVADGSISDYVEVTTSVGTFTSNVVTVPTNVVPSPPLIGVLGLYKNLACVPANGVYFTEGEWIDYDIVVVNYDLAVDGEIYSLSDAVNGEPETFILYATVTVPAGADLHYGYYHLVTAEDVARGYVLNKATCESSFGTLVSSVTVPCGVEIIDSYELPSLDIAKYEISTPANGNYYEEGEWIDFEIVVTNKSGEDVYNATIEDNINGVGPAEINSGMMIPAGSSVGGIYFSHLVDASDVARGYVFNVATVLYSEGYINSNVVKVPVGMPAPVPTPVIPTGTIDKGDTCCERILNAYAPNGMTYTMHFCGEHNAVTAAAAEATQAEARALWTDAINAMYDRCMKDASSGSARSIVEQERSRFWTMIETREALLAATGKDASEVITLLQMHCADLCWSLTNGPDLRPDSINNPVPALDIPAAAQCATAMGETRDNGFDYSLTICEGHARTEATVQQLVLEAQTPEALSAAFIRAQRLYQTELDGLTNKIYRTAGENKDLVSADRIAFGSWVKNHIDFLSLIYLDSFQIQEIAARHIANRVSQLCG